MNARLLAFRLRSNRVEASLIFCSQNIVEILEVVEDDNEVAIVMEYCPHGDLLTYVRARRRLSEVRGRNAFRKRDNDMATALTLSGNCRRRPGASSASCSSPWIACIGRVTSTAT